MDLKPSMWRAIELSKKNSRDAEKLDRKFKSLKKTAKDLDRRYNLALETAFDEVLAPFAADFSRLKNVDLEEPDLLDRVPKVEGVSPGTVDIGFDAVKGLVSLAGGSAAGVAAGGLTFAAVGAFATASTGAAISGLSGAAATSATLAWLGGGSLAAGGGGVAAGTLVLAGVVAVPVMLAAGGFLYWKGNKELAKQQQVQQKLRQARAQFKKDAKRVEEIGKRVNDGKQTLSVLKKAARPLLKWLHDLIQIKDDYRQFTEEERNKLAVLVQLVTLTSVVVSQQILSPKGGINKEHATVMKTARRSVEAVAA